MSDLVEEDTGMLTVISLGAGVQSSVMALMAAHGEIDPMPDCAIFADTKAEPRRVYDWLDWLETQLPFPVCRVSKGSLRQNIIDSSTPNEDGEYTNRFAAAPFFTTSANGGGMLRRQCTNEYKIQPITKKVRELAGLKPRQRAPKGKILVEQWIGISWDEMQRMKAPREKWLRHRWPLIERKMTRLHCLEWMRDNGYNEFPAKSSCTFCPYHDRAMWLDMKENDPVSFEDACQVDEAIRHGVRGTTENLYVHSSLIPLREVDFTDPAADQLGFSFMDECEGMCGL